MRFKFGEADTAFMVGTMINPPNADSQGRNGKWCVNCINMWASLGKRLNPNNAVLKHLVIVLHELTHAMSDVFHKQGDDPNAWDITLDRILSEFNKKDDKDV